MLQVVNSLFQTCYNKLGTSSAKTTCEQTCNNLFVGLLQAVRFYACRGLTTSQTLIDVLLTNQPELFKSSGVLNPELSDHKLIYGIMNEKVQIHKNRVITYRSVKYFNVEKYKEDRKNAPWQVGEILESIDDKAKY